MPPCAVPEPTRRQAGAFESSLCVCPVAHGALTPKDRLSFMDRRRGPLNGRGPAGTTELPFQETQNRYPEY
jgi:hypothetical protein